MESDPIYGVFTRGGRITTPFLGRKGEDDGVAPLRRLVVDLNLIYGLSGVATLALLVYLFWALFYAEDL
jgi:K+-transporting ATPase KdpF subunit